MLLRLFNVFSTAALRFGHTLIRDQFELLARGVAFQNQPEPVPTRDFFNPALFYEEIEAGGSLRSPYGLILRGLVGRRAQQVDGYVRYFNFKTNSLLVTTLNPKTLLVLEQTPFNFLSF